LQEIIERAETARRALAAGDLTAADEWMARVVNHLNYCVPTVSESPVSAQELRVAATACMAAAGVRRSIGSFLLDDEPDRVTHEALTLETVGAKLAALAETLDGNR
jgi:hypothetical protein